MTLRYKDIFLYALPATANHAEQFLPCDPFARSRVQSGIDSDKGIEGFLWLGVLFVWLHTGCLCLDYALGMWDLFARNHSCMKSYTLCGHAYSSDWPSFSSHRLILHTPVLSLCRKSLQGMLEKWFSIEPRMKLRLKRLLENLKANVESRWHILGSWVNDFTSRPLSRQKGFLHHVKSCSRSSHMPQKYDSYVPS